MATRRTKLFLSHASEDKLAIVDALAEALSVDFDVWYDKKKLTLGDRLFQKINEGLREADFGVVVLSPRFFGKKWTTDELEGLVALEEQNRKVILPVWHEVSADDVRTFASILGGRIGISTAEGIPAIVAAIHAAVDASHRTAELDPNTSIKSRLLRMDGEIGDAKRNKQMLGSTEGVRKVRASVEDSANRLIELVDDLGKVSEQLKFVGGNGLNDATRRVLSFRMPYKLSFAIEYTNTVINSAEDAYLAVGIWHVERDMWGTETKRTKLVEHYLRPRFAREGNVEWTSDDLELSEEQLPTFLLELMVSEVEKEYEKRKTS